LYTTVSRLMIPGHVPHARGSLVWHEHHYAAVMLQNINQTLLALIIAMNRKKIRLFPELAQLVALYWQ
jgi:hypothetical protein